MLPVRRRRLLRTTLPSNCLMGVVREKLFIDRTEPKALHSEEVADGREEDFIAALKIRRAVRGLGIKALANRAPHVDVPFPIAIFLLPQNHVLDFHGRLATGELQSGASDFETSVSKRFEIDSLKLHRAEPHRVDSDLPEAFDVLQARDHFRTRRHYTRILGINSIQRLEISMSDHFFFKDSVRFLNVRRQGWIHR